MTNLYEEWPEEEVDNYNRNYKHLRIVQMGPIYFMTNLKPDAPHKRAKFLAEKLNFSEKDIKGIDEVMERYGKAHALGCLEERIIKNFF